MVKVVMAVLIENATTADFSFKLSITCDHLQTVEKFANSKSLMLTLKSRRVILFSMK